jgi:shikimate dehydrogenase
LPERRVSGRKLACIIGWPVSQSLSPAIQNAAFAELGLDWTYIPLAVRAGAVDEGVNLLRLLDVDGANVTTPHKRTVVPLLDRLDGDAAAIDAVNTIVREGTALVGNNTDGAGFIAAVRAEAGFEPEGKRALVLGAGGAARAVAFAMAQAGAAVSVAARRGEQAAELAELAPGIGPVPWEDLPQAELIVNATSSRDGLPLERLGFGPGVVAVDLIYPPPLTDFVRTAQAAGAVAFDGLGMLIHQAALSFHLWTGLEAPIAVMTQAARAALSKTEPEASE